MFAIRSHEKGDTACDRHNARDWRERQGPLTIRRRMNRPDINDGLTARIRDAPIDEGYDAQYDQHNTCYERWLHASNDIAVDAATGVHNGTTKSTAASWVIQNAQSNRRDWVALTILPAIDLVQNLTAIVGLFKAY